MALLWKGGFSAPPPPLGVTKRVGAKAARATPEFITSSEARRSSIRPMAAKVLMCERLKSLKGIQEFEFAHSSILLNAPRTKSWVDMRVIKACCAVGPAWQLVTWP